MAMSAALVATWLILLAGLGAALRVETVNEDLEQTYDFIVVGAGVAGGVLAAKLAELSPESSLLVIETGKDESANPLLRPSYFFISSKFTHLYRNYFSQEGPNIDNRRLYHMSTKALGGGSSINAMVWTWGDPRDWQLWTQKAGGLPGWTYEDVQPYFQALESYEHEDPSGLRGCNGPVHVSVYKPNNVTRQAVERASAVFGVPVLKDNNAKVHEGSAVLQRNVRGDQPITAERQSSWTSFLLPAKETRPNLQILTGATVIRVNLDESSGRATGVRLLLGGKCIDVDAGEEVILSLGGHNTPKLLLLSGIGNSTELAGVGVQGTVELPGVGKNMMDHINPGSLLFTSKPRDDYDGNLVATYGRTGIVPGELTPDTEFGYIMGPAAEGRENWSKVPSIHMFYCLMLNHDALGSIRLYSNDPLEDPMIESGYFKTEMDRRRVVRIIRLLFQWASDLAKFVPMEHAMDGPYPLQLTPDSTDEEVLAEVKNKVDTHWHVSGTARMGTSVDPFAVVDGHFRVHGVAGLRVVDASAMPHLTNGHPMATIMMMASRAAEWIAAGE